ncbi:hypothetical protein ACQ859_23690 [Roseateles chitinivorans]|uniref:hypothetical protein n=1 Tax=Roseateles chitinivorans TaxID=2917965 RepID=UPI003D66A235
MAIGSKELFVFAQTLSGDGSEVATRDAISRAYYAAFHRCRAWEQSLPELGSNEGPGGGSHQELINRLKHPSRKCGEILRDRSRANGTQLEVQRDRRQLADYDLEEDVTPAVMHDQLSQVRQLLRRCDEPLPATAPPKPRP